MPTGNIPSLYLITDRKIACPDLETALEGALRGGARMIQLREKDLPPSALESLARACLRLVRNHGARLLLNGDPELAAAIGADGVHLGVNGPSIHRARRILGANALIGYSAHSLPEVFAAADQGADFVTFSPVFYTPSKAQYGPPQGVEALRNLCRTAPLPVYALGGVNIERIDEILAAGACGVATISAVFAAANPQTAVVALLKELSSARGRS